MSDRRWKRIGIRLAGIGLVLAFFFGVNEWIVRALAKDRIVLFPRYHTDAQYGEFTIRSLRPSMQFTHTSVDGSWKFTTNDRGLRGDKDLDYAKRPGTLRVLVLGDSQAQGYESHQHDTFPAVIEKQLSDKGYAVEVINAGISGFGTAEELIYLENEGIRYDPDFVVLAYTDNDIRDNVKSDLYRLSGDGELFVHSYTHIPGVAVQNFIYSFPFTQWLSEHSYFYSLMFNEVWDYFKARLGRQAQERVTSYEESTPVDESESADYGTLLTSALIKRMYAFCKAHDVKFLILDVPGRTEDDGVKSSFPEPLAAAVFGDSDAFVESVPMLTPHTGREEFFVPHGARHVTRFTHYQLGLATAETIESLLAGGKHH